MFAVGGFQIGFAKLKSRLSINSAWNGSVPNTRGSPVTTKRSLLRSGSKMDEKKIDPATLGRLAKALNFICGADHPTTAALKAAAESGTERDVKAARSLFLKLKPGDRRAALTMIDDRH
ncbi:MAG: hypothetical protein OEU26_17595 [Candidatus Tectomicrobia bacterium]|nr:hypothetical protein [Candidatus Tectomicrobia bacterium]